MQGNIWSLSVWDTSCLAELIYNIINRQLLCRKCPKPVNFRDVARHGLGYVPEVKKYCPPQ